MENKIIGYDVDSHVYTLSDDTRNANDVERLKHILGEDIQKTFDEFLKDKTEDEKQFLTTWFNIMNDRNDVSSYNEPFDFVFEGVGIDENGNVVRDEGKSITFTNCRLDVGAVDVSSNSVPVTIYMGFKK